MSPQKIGSVIDFASRQQNRYLFRRLAHLDVNPGILPYFITVSLNEGISQKDLTQKIGTDKTQTTKAISRLERLGYIERRKKTEDLRINGLYLTSSGKYILPEVMHILDDVDRLLAKDFPEEDRDVFFRILSAFGKALSDASRDLERKALLLRIETSPY